MPVPNWISEETVGQSAVDKCQATLSTARRPVGDAMAFANLYWSRGNAGLKLIAWCSH